MEALSVIMLAAVLGCFWGIVVMYNTPCSDGNKVGIRAVVHPKIFINSTVPVMVVTTTICVIISVFFL